MLPSVVEGLSGTHRGYRVSGSEYDVVVRAPVDDLCLWEEYVAGAERSYRAHGVGGAFDAVDLRDPRSSSMLFAVLSPERHVIGGARVRGPFSAAGEANSVNLWLGHPAEAVAFRAIEARLPEGVVELTGAWVDRDSPARGRLGLALARMPLHAAALLGVRWVLGTTAAQRVAGWGAAVAQEVPAVNYPDDRYRTCLAWVDGSATATSLSEAKRRAVDEEAAQLFGSSVPVQEPRR